MLQIMSSDSASQSSLVFSMAIRFYLWKVSDKFFEGQNVHKTVQVLFNLLLNGEIDFGGLCAGELLSDLCTEPNIMPLVASFPELKESIQEIMIQLKSKDTSLLLKLLHLLYRLAENQTNPEVGEYIRSLVFSESTGSVINGNQRNAPMEVENGATDEHESEPLQTLFALSSNSGDDLVASAALDLLLQLTTKLPSEGPDVAIHELLLEHIIDGMRKLGDTTAFRSTDTFGPSMTDSVLCGRLLHLSLFIRLADEVVRQLQKRTTSSDSLTNNTECTFLTNPTSSVLIDHLSVLSEFMHQICVKQLKANPLLNLFSRPTCDPISEVMNGPQFHMEMNSCIVSGSVILEAMGLIHSVAELLSTVVPSASQDEEVSATQPTEADDDGIVTRLGENKTIQTVARQCGQSLQSLLERVEVAGLFALGLLTTSRHLHCPTDVTDTPSSMPLGMGPVSRGAVIRLLSTALHWDGFDNERFVHHLNRLQPGNTATGTNLNELLGRISGPSEMTLPDTVASFDSHTHSSPAFLARWIHSAVSGDPVSVNSQSAQSSSNMHSSLFDSPSATDSVCVTDALVDRVDQFLQHWESDKKSRLETSIDASDILSMLEYKVQVFKSREDVLEASAFANAEALASAQRLAEHYRQRLTMAEAESGRLRSLQLDALARLEADKRVQLTYVERLKKTDAELEDVRTQLKQRTKECQDLTAKNENLQSKLTAAREQNRAMDLTIDDYRTQLDQAKEQIQAQTAQIAKFTQITRLINDLTGNPAADVTTVGLGASDTGINTTGISTTNGPTPAAVTGGGDSVSPVAETAPRSNAAVTRRMTTARAPRR
ncbi:unnamed protein product [Echinostoma caproni]|uniref:CIP2A N-terminal domain-containing protein n=1 Tax=Echinostoma caproni TaxID=27848 RepID=A0A3P8FV13_9TREM|nr:unnamed protein product [Echinostoma caproni]